MNILLKKIHIVDPESPYDGMQKDIFIQDGIIKSIGEHLQIEAPAKTEIVEENGLSVSQGWVDIFSHFNDPGLEYKETLETGASAAAAGGYTKVFVLPNTKPAIQNKSQVEYIVQKSRSLPIDVLPIGSVSQNLEGKDIAEMYDMYHSGAVAFSDGLLPVQSAGLFLKMLQYIKAFDGVIIQQPFDNSISAHGMINEGIISTQMGLPGLPAIAEEIFLQRDIELLKYTESRLHITGVSTAKGIDAIKKAKDQGLSITCSVTPYHLTFCDEDLHDYDTNLKVNPPLRTSKDRTALREAVLHGDVDLIASHHMPQHWDNKVIEFEYAKNGMIGLQTAFAAVVTALPELNVTKIVQLFSTNARSVFHLNSPVIREGNHAELTIFSTQGNTILTKENNKSKSSNTPFMNQSLQGHVTGIIHKGRLTVNA